jgi:hypothetical protein
MCKIDGSVIINLDGVGSRIFLGTWAQHAAEFIVIQPYVSKGHKGNRNMSRGEKYIYISFF